MPHLYSESNLKGLTTQSYFYTVVSLLHETYFQINKGQDYTIHIYEVEECTTLIVHMDESIHQPFQNTSASYYLFSELSPETELLKGNKINLEFSSIYPVKAT